MKATCAVALLLLGAIGEAAAQGNRPELRPAGVTDSAIAWGRELFHGSANCAGCHGEAGRGTDRGPNITGAIWLHGPGTYWSISHPPQPPPPSRRRPPAG